MDRVIERCRMLCIAVTLGFVATQAAELPASARVVVHAGHYESGGHAYHDLDALEHAWWAGGVRAAELDACGAGATRGLLAAAHRLRHVVVHIRPQACPDGGKRQGRVGARNARIAGIDDAAVNRYWAQLQP